MNKKELQQKKLAMLQEMKQLMEARNAKLREEAASRPGAGLAKLLEGELERAELTLNAQDVVNKLQDTAEDLAKMSVEQLMPLVDEMKGEFGPEAAQKFETEVGGALDTALQAVRDAREQVNNAVLKMQGKLSDEDVTVPDNDMADDIGGGVGLDGPNDMADDPLGAEEPADDLGLDVDAGDDFAGEPAAAGPEEEPLGRAKKESRTYSKKKSELTESKHEEALLEAFVELTESGDFDSLKLEIVADKYGVCEEELAELYNSAESLLEEVKSYRIKNTSALREALGIEETEKLDEFLPLLAPLAGAAARTVGGAALKGLGGLAKGAAKSLGKAALRKGGSMAMDKVGDMMGLGGDEKPGQATAPKTPADQARDEQKMKRDARNNPDLRKLAAKFKVQPQDLADLGATIMASDNNDAAPLNEHRIIEEIAGVPQDDAIKLVKERIKAVKTGKDLAVRETFPADVQLTTPRAVVKQLSAKYGDPAGWAVARSDEGSYYVLSSPIPEVEKARSLQGEIQGLEEEITGIREKHADVQAEYQLPQEIKMGELRQRLGEYETGYRHQVAKWMTFEEASALVTLAQTYGSKKKGK